MNAVSMANYASECCRDLKIGCAKVEKERDEELRKKSLPQRIGFVACKVLQNGGMGIALASFTIGTFFSFSFLLVGAAALAAFAVGVVARSFFETISPREELLISRIKGNPILAKKDNLPSADQLKALRAGMINDVAKDQKLDQKSEKTNLGIFVDFFGGKGLTKKLASDELPTAEDRARVTELAPRFKQIRALYITSHLLEAIQHVAKGRFAEAQANAKFVQSMNHNVPDPVKLSDDFRQKTDLLAARFKDPSKELQQKVKQAVGKKFQLSDLDSVYNAVA